MRELERAGVIVAVVWENRDCEKILSKTLDRLHSPRYIVTTSQRTSTEQEKGETEMAPATKSKSKPAKATKATRKAPAQVVDEEDEDLDDLEDLEDFEDDDDESEDDDEEPEPTVKAKRTTPGKATKTVAKSKTTAKNGSKPVAKARGNADNLQPRRLTEGMVGASAIAEEIGSDPRSIRTMFRSLGVEKNANGMYEWKPGSKQHQAIVKQIKAEIKRKSA